METIAAQEVSRDEHFMHRGARFPLYHILSNEHTFSVLVYENKLHFVFSMNLLRFYQ